MSDPTIKNDVSRSSRPNVFYEFENLDDWSAAGTHCVGYRDEWKGIVARAGGDSAPDIVRHLNQVLYCNFGGQDHYVALEEYRGQYFYVHRWRNDLAESVGPKAIVEFHPYYLPIMLGGMLLFQIASENEGEEAVTVVPFDPKSVFDKKKFHDVNFELKQNKFFIHQKTVLKFL